MALVACILREIRVDGVFGPLNAFVGGGDIKLKD